MIIVVANSKGGVGKSTLAVHLAAWLHEQGFTVTLADCDAQQSSSEWAEEATPGVTPVRLTDAEEILDELPQLGKEVDFVVADGPGSNSEVSRALLCLGRLRPRALQGQHAGGARPGQSHQGPAPRPRRPQGTAAGADRAQHGRQELPPDPGHESRRRRSSPASGEHRARPAQIYADAPGQGAVVWHLGARGREAAREVRSLFREALADTVTAAKQQAKQAKQATG